LKREVILLDSFDDLINKLIYVLTENGYIVHIITSYERGEEFIDKPVYIHSIDLNSIQTALSEESLEKIFHDIEFENVEIGILVSPNDDLNLSIARYLRRNGVPRIIVSLRSDEKSAIAEKEGFQVVNVPNCVLGRIQRILSLKFTRISPLRGNISILESLVTGDMKILGKTIAELERDYNVSIIIIRNGDKILNGGDEEIQEGDYIVVVGSTDNLIEMIR
jgi:trk system potassium uptake protein TrkA